MPRMCLVARVRTISSAFSVSGGDGEKTFWTKNKLHTGPLAEGFLLKDGKDSTSQSFGKAMTTKMMVARMDQ
jgi:hypothetical protein